MAVQLFAVMYPRPGKADRVAELLATMATHTKTKEPRVLQYQLLREAKPDSEFETFLQLETYTSHRDFQDHMATEYCKEFMMTLEKEDLMAQPPIFKFVTPAAGFASR